MTAALRSWPFDPWLLAMLLLSAGIYVRGWRVYHRRDPARWPVARLITFLAGLGTVFLALASPIEPFASLLLWVHMLQHLLLMMLAPPLLLFGFPLLPMVRGLPQPVRVFWIAPLFRTAMLRRVFSRLTHPYLALPLFIAMTWLWHTPSAYELALQSPAWHTVQHLCFLAAGVLFWFPVVRPYPSQPKWPLGLLFPYLLIADLSNTALSALLTFSDQVLYPHYELVPRIDGRSALDDQAIAGVLMWVPGSIAFLVPLFALGLRMLFAEKPKPRPKRIALPMTATMDSRFDLLRVPVVGRFLNWKHSRMALQVPMLLLAVAVMIDGFTGPAVAPFNLAGVLPWIHWRGLLILTLLVAGNFFCTACPFTLPRNLARRWLPGGWTWPRLLRSKWLAIALLVLFFMAYEAFSLWDNPLLTAVIIAGYFLAAFTVDALFRGATFCKYVCPIGQFNFVQSLASPLEVAVRNPAVCKSCTTKDCISACELKLVPPQKQGNMDCTFCLDCVHACPHDNLGILAQRSQLTPPRTDLAAMILVLVFAAFANAAGMTAPMLQWQDTLGKSLGLTSTLSIVITFNLLVMVLIPLLILRLSRSDLRMVYALVPLGFAMWLAHYGYHLVTSYETAGPVALRFLGLGDSQAVCNCCRDVGAWLVKAEIVILDIGLLASLFLAHRLRRGSTRNLLTWCLLILAFFAVGVWILLQPMDMRGTVGMS
ncbi:hypothetical protein BH11PLA2_BH11PLA2_16650 [soil metagenome]